MKKNLNLDFSWLRDNRELPDPVSNYAEEESSTL